MLYIYTKVNLWEKYWSLNKSARYSYTRTHLVYMHISSLLRRISTESMSCMEQKGMVLDPMRQTNVRQRLKIEAG